MEIKLKALCCILVTLFVAGCSGFEELEGNRSITEMGAPSNFSNASTQNGEGNKLPGMPGKSEGFDRRGIPSGMGPNFGRMEKMRAGLFGGTFNTPGVDPANPGEGRSQKNKVSLERVKIDYNKGEYQKAVVGFQAFIDKNPEHEMVPEAYLFAGKASYALKDYNAAISAFTKVERDYTRYPKVAEAMYGKAKSLAALGKTKVARRLFRKIKSFHPEFTKPTDFPQ